MPRQQHASGRTLAGSLASTIKLGTSPSNQIFTLFLAEPRTYGVTARVRF